MPVFLEDLHFPSSPGVYLFKTIDDRVLYIGKATRLNEKIRSYFAQQPDRAMIPELVERSNQVDFIVTASAQDALILERNLIRERTRAGLEAARARGRMGGRPKSIDRKTFAMALQLYEAKQSSVGEICERLGIKARTFYRYLKAERERASLSDPLSESVGSSS